MFMAVCENEVTVDLFGNARCSSGWQNQVAAAPFDYSQIQPDVAVSMFGLGFVLVAVPWATAFGLGRVIEMFRTA